MAKITIAVLMISIMIAVSLPVNADKPAYTGVKYPQTAWSDRTGQVTGRVVASANGTGVGGTYVAIVNAMNVSQEYCNTTTDAYGNYQFVGVNATYNSELAEGWNGQTGPDYITSMYIYRVYANKSPYGEGYSLPFGIDTSSGGPTTAVVISHKAYTGKIGARTIWSDTGKGGRISGVVCTPFSRYTEVGYAYVALVNASNASREYANTTSDANGMFDFADVNATYDSALKQGPHGQTDDDYTLGTGMYRIHASKSPYGEGWSDAFGIDAIVNTSTLVSVNIDTPTQAPSTAPALATTPSANATPIPGQTPMNPATLPVAVLAGMAMAYAMRKR